MKTKSLLFALLGLVSVAFIACDQKNTPEEPVDPQDTTVVPVDTTDVPVDTTDVPVDTIPASFPKKHLIEEFTGQGCGYCPYGMDCIHDFVKGDSNWVLLLHHSGYSDDNFTITADKTIANSLGVNGAPSMSINRAKTNYGSGKAVVFHPGYLPNTNKSQFETETYASISIENTYDPATRELKVKVSGAIAIEDYPALKLSVFVKESGVIDYQADYYETFEGWTEFCHTNAVRACLTNAKGDALDIDSTRHYVAEFTTTLKDHWTAPNCMVVAFISEAFKPVVQAEEAPVVEGTTGGADIEHGGITKAEVADYYPEYDAEKGPADYSGNVDGETMKMAYYYYESYPSYGFNLFTIHAYSTTNAIKIENTNCVPFAMMYVFTDLNTTTLSGEYEFKLTQEPGTGWAGYRDDENYDVGGSEFTFSSQAYLQQNYIVPVAEWLIADGTLTIGKTGLSVSGHAKNGSEIKFSYSGSITDYGKQNAPQRIQKRKENPFAKYIPAIEYCK